jgi:glucosylceramidase
MRIASTSFGTTGWNGQVMDVAFRDPDGTIVLVAHNENDNPQAFAVREGARSFTYTLPGGALATFTWRGKPSSQTLQEIDPAGWTATANPNGPSNPCCQGDVAANAVDDDASTRYSTGTGQQPGQYLQVDLGRPEAVREVVFDTGAGTSDYPRGYSVQVSADGATWSTAVAAGSGSGQLTAVPLSGAPIRFVRMTLTQPSGSWWSVADVRSYTAR